MPGDHRARAAEHAAHVDAAAELWVRGPRRLRRFPRARRAAGLLAAAGRHISRRPGRGIGPFLPVAGWVLSVFKVQLPVRLAAAVREHAPGRYQRTTVSSQSPHRPWRSSSAVAHGNSQPGSGSCPVRRRDASTARLRHRRPNVSRPTASWCRQRRAGTAAQAAEGGSGDGSSGGACTRQVSSTRPTKDQTIRLRAVRVSARPRRDHPGLTCRRSGCSPTRGVPAPRCIQPRWRRCGTWPPRAA